MAYIAPLLIISLAAWYGVAIRTTPAAIPDAVFSEAKCRYLFNELNTFGEDDQFIEISKYCLQKPKAPRPKSMRNFRVVFINHEGYLIGVCKLHGMMKSRGKEKYWFFTIGRRLNSQNIDYDISNCELPPTTGNDNQDKFFPRGINYPIGLGLVYSDRSDNLKSLQLLQEGDNWKKVKMDAGMESLVMRSLIDFYVYGAGTKYVWCKKFAKFYDGFGSMENPLLRDWQGDNAADLSISRCGTDDRDTITLPFQNQLWAYTVRTPGSINACKSGFRYSIEDAEPQTKRKRIDITERNGEYFECTAITDNQANQGGEVAFRDDFQDALNAAIKDNRNQGSFSDVPPFHRTELAEDDSTPDAQMEIEVETACESDYDGDDQQVDGDEMVLQEMLPHIDDVSTPIGTPESVDNTFTATPTSTAEFDALLVEGKPYIWDTCSDFDIGISQRMDNIPGTPYDEKEILKSDVCPWFELTDKNLMRCKLCNKLVNYKILFDRPGSPNITKIMTTGIGSLEGENRRSFNRQHLKNPMHKISLEFFEKVNQGMGTADIVNYMETNPGEYLNFYNQTRSMLLTVYQAVRLGLPFYRFGILIDTLKHFGVPLGHLYANEQGMQKLAVSISNSMHQAMIQSLLEEKMPIAILLDEVLDVSKKAVVAVMFQTFSSDKEVKVYFYRLIDLKGNATGDNIFNKFKEALQQDSLEAFIKEYLVGMVTDGGSNFRKTFRAKLKSYISNELLAVHCKCHVLERVNFHAYRQVPYFKVIDKKTNEIFGLFNSKSAKRKQALEYMIITNKDSHFEVKKIQTIRWIASKFCALKHIMLHWKTILQAVQRIIEDESFDEKTRLDAATIEAYLLDPIFLSSLAFCADIARALATVSEEFQTRGFSLILVKLYRDLLMQRLSEFDPEYEGYVKTMLSQMEFSNPIQNGVAAVTIDSLETELVTFQGIALRKPTPIPGYSLLQYFQKYLTSLSDQVDNYFPGGIEDNFAVFDPMGLEELVRSSDFDCPKIQDLNQNLKWGYEDDDLCIKWRQLVTEIVLYPTFSKLKNNQPEEFWSTFLMTDLPTGWTPAMQDIIGKSISQPATSSEVERLFSMYAATKTLRRYLLKVSTVEAILRIRFNGSKNLKEVDVDRLLRDFLVAHSRADDRSRRETWSPVKLGVTEAVEEQDNGDESDTDSESEDTDTL